MTTPAAPEIYTTSSKQVLVTRDPVYSHPAIKDGSYIGKQPPSYLTFAIVVTVIAPLFGPLAIFFAILSRRAYRDGDITYANKWSQYAFLAGCIAIVAQLVLGIAIFFALAKSCTLKSVGGIEECNSGVSGGHSY